MSTEYTPRDWRGTPITPGALVVYGAGVGRSIELVEGTVDSFTKSGRVNVRVIRRSFTTTDRDVVHVGADRLTVVTALPPTVAPTQDEKKAAAAARWAAIEAHRATHRPEGVESPWSRYTSTCGVCGGDWRVMNDRDCEVPA